MLTTTLSLRPDRFNQEPTMSSIDLLEMVNAARLFYGEGEIRRNDFTARCRDELDGEYYETFVVKNPHGPASEIIRMTRDQCMYVLMRESKAVRRTVTAELNKLATPRELTRIELLQIAMDSEQKRLTAESERDHAIATKAQIGNRREATAMATASATRKENSKLKDQLGFSARHATILQVEDAMRGDFDFVPLRRWCKANEVTPETVPDKRYPRGVKAWPAGAWAAVYGVNLVELFGTEV